MSGPLAIALFGHPLGHSRSRALFEALRAAGGPAVSYTPVDVTPGEFPRAVDRLRRGELHGANVTIPFKEEAAALADHVTPFASRARAANVLRREPDGRVSASNTDGAGFLASLRHFGERADCAGAPAVVLGGGGAARAIVVALVDAGARVTVVCRDRTKGGAPLHEPGTGIVEWTDPHLAAVIAEAELIVQATSLGMAPRTDELPPVPLGALRAGQRVVDIVYNPWETAFLRACRARGLAALNGWPMLVHQAALSLELWCGMPGEGRALIDAAATIESRDPLSAGPGE